MLCRRCLAPVGTAAQSLMARPGLPVVAAGGADLWPPPPWVLESGALFGAHRPPESVSVWQTQ